MTKTIAILQPGYLPWLGFFEQMAYADLFVYMDDVQYTRKDWRSRNQIKINGKAHWLTVPVKKAPLDTHLRDIEISYEENWVDKHISSIRLAYCKAKFFSPLFEQITEEIEKKTHLLWEMDVGLASIMARAFGLNTPIAYSSQAPRLTQDKNQRIIEICQHFGATRLYDGKAAADFIDPHLFSDNGVQVVFQNYAHPTYWQGRGDFLPYMSAIDLLFHTGEHARDTLLSSPNPFSRAAA